MARRKDSPVEDFIVVVARLPWWACVLLAVIAHLALHKVASQPMPTSVQIGQVGGMATQSLWRALAELGQYLLPLLCLAAAGLSAWRRREATQLLDRAVKNDAADALDGMSWKQFERLVGEGFRLQGYRVIETGGGGPDGGVDLVLSRDGEKSLVQCKQWRALRVGVDVVRELYGVMAARGAAGGFVVTSGRFTDEARRFASGRNIELIDGPRLQALLRQATGSPGGNAAATARAAAAQRTQAAPPPCPLCAKPMVQRTAKRGQNSGAGFWGCSGYPACKGTRPAG